MAHRINFYLKDKDKTWTTIFCSVHYMGRRYWVMTHESIESKFWIHELQKCRTGKQYEDGDSINERLDIWRKVIKEALKKFQFNLYPPSVRDFQREIDRLKTGPAGMISFTGWVKDFIPRSGRMASTCRRYGTTLNWLKEYEGKRKLQFGDIDINFYRSFHAWIDRKGLTLNSFGTAIKHIQVWMNESEAELNHGCMGHKHPKFTPISENTDSIYLTESELLKIHNLELTWELILENFPAIKNQDVMRKIESYKVIRDRFLIGCFTALRVSDFNRLSVINIDDEFIRIRPMKGSQKNADVIIPVHYVIREIISRGFDWDKKVYDQKINENIKHICKMAGIKGKVVTSRTEGGKLVNTTSEKWELVTTHTARRSGATNMFKAGIPSLSIMMITGHRTEKSFLKYIKIGAEENARILKDHKFFKG